MSLPNIINVSQIYGFSIGYLLTTSSQDVLLNGVGASIKVNTIMCCNITAISQAVTVNFYDVYSSSSYSIINQAIIPAYSSLDVLVRPFYLKEGDKIQGLAGNSNAIHIILSYETIQ